MDNASKTLFEINPKGIIKVSFKRIDEIYSEGSIKKKKKNSQKVAEKLIKKMWKKFRKKCRKYSQGNCWVKLQGNWRRKSQINLLSIHKPIVVKIRNAYQNIEVIAERIPRGNCQLPKTKVKNMKRIAKRVHK